VVDSVVTCMDTAPATSLDPRFSDPHARPTPWRETERILETAPLSWISTVRADGSPHVTPLVHVWHENAAYFCTGPDEQKAVNLRDNPRVVLTTGDNGWQDGLDVMVEGRAAVVTDTDLLRTLAAKWAAKWDGESWEFSVEADGFHHGDGGLAVVYEVAPTKVLAFAKGDAFSHTRHRFT
jgi:general stress protein 26